MLPTHNKPTGQPLSHVGEQGNSPAEPPLPSSFVGKGLRPAHTDINGRSIGSPRQPAGSETASTVVAIKAEQIQESWKEQLKSRYWVQTLQALELSPLHLAMLEEQHVINRDISQCIASCTSDRDRNRLLLKHLQNGGAQITLAHFLNFLNQTRGDVASHGALFKEMIEDPKMVGPASASPLPPTAESETAPTVVAIKAELIQEGWQDRLRTRYWVQTLQALQLSPLHLAMLKEQHIINCDTSQRAESCTSNRDRNRLVLKHLQGGGAQITLANFLNFLNQTRGDVASHGALFKEMVEDPKMVGPASASHLPPAAERQAHTVSYTPLQPTQTTPEPMDSTPSAPQVAAPDHGPSTSVPYKQLLRDRRPYFLRYLQAEYIYNSLLSNKAISYQTYKAIKAAPSSLRANELLIEFIEQAPDAVPWNGLVTTLQTQHLQDGLPILKDVSAHISLYAEKISDQKMAQGRCDQQPLPSHKKVLQQKWAYLAGRPLAKAVVDELVEKGIPSDLYERIDDASSDNKANEILLEYLYEADSDEHFLALLQVLSSPHTWQDYPILENIHRSLVSALAASNNR